MAATTTTPEAARDVEETFEYCIRSFWAKYRNNRSEVQAFVKKLLELIEQNPEYSCSLGKGKTWAWEAGRIAASLTYLLIIKFNHCYHRRVSKIEEDEVVAYLLGNEVGALMRKLATLSDGSVSLLEGMSEALMLRHSLNYLAHYTTNNLTLMILVKFMHNSIMSAQKECLIKETGSMRKMLQFCTISAGYENKPKLFTSEYEFPTTELEEIIFPLIQSVLQTETNESLNMTSESTCRKSTGYFTIDILWSIPDQQKSDSVAQETNEDSRHLPDLGNSSALHFAAGFLLLPRVTKLLLSNPDIDVNITGEGSELTPVDVALQAMVIYNYKKEAILETISALLDHHKFHYSNLNRDFGWAIVRSSAEHQRKKTHMETIMAVLHRIVSHPSSLQNADFVMDTLFTLVTYEQHIMDNNCYAEIIDKVLASKFADVMEERKFLVFRHYPPFPRYDKQMKETLLNGSLIDLFLGSSEIGTEYRSKSFTMFMTKRITEHISFNVSKCNSGRNNVLMNISKRIFYYEHGSIDEYDREIKLLRISLDHDSADVAVKNGENNRPVDICINGFMADITSGKFKRLQLKTLFFLHFMEVLNEHKTSNANHIYCSLIAIIKVYHKLEGDAAFKERKNAFEEFGSQTFKASSYTMIHKVIRALCNSPKFDVNYADEETRETVAHIAAENNNVSILNLLIKKENFEPNIPDKDGNTPAFNIVRYVKRCEDIGSFLKKLKPKLDLTLTNIAGQNIQDMCDFKFQPATKKTIERILNVQRGITQAALIDNHDIRRPPAEIQGHDIQLHQMPGQATSGNTINKVTMAEMKRIIQCQQEKKLSLYDMTASRKGKVCIISIHRFQVPWLQTLDGYSHDRLQLQQLWQEMGFLVYIPRTVQPYDDNLLTTQEIECAVRKFAGSLEADDSCAVLCILSHGGNGFVYGVDGKRVSIKRLTSYLDNVKCPKMMDKPKVVIIQACNGDKTDSGVLAAGASALEVIPAAMQELLPSISDTIIIHPSQPEFVSYVYRTPGEGSVLIKYLTQIFREYAATEDIHTLLTRINKEVSDLNLPHVPAPGVMQEYKQMPEFRSSMRRLLYFFPLRAEEQPNISMEDGAHDVTEERTDVSGDNIADATSAVQVNTSNNVIDNIII